MRRILLGLCAFVFVLAGCSVAPATEGEQPQFTAEELRWIEAVAVSEAANRGEEWAIEWLIAEEMPGADVGAWMRVFRRESGLRADAVNEGGCYRPGKSRRCLGLGQHDEGYWWGGRAQSAEVDPSWWWDARSNIRVTAMLSNGGRNICPHWC